MLKRVRERIAFWYWYLTEFRPLAGGAPDDDTDTDKGGDDDKGGSGDDDTETDADADKGGGGEDDKPPAIPDGKELVDKDEHNRLKRELSKLSKAERARKRKEAEDEDRHGDVVKAVEEERDEEKARADRLEAELAASKRTAVVTAIAGRLKFNDASDAVAFLPTDTPDDEASIERALKKVAKEKPYLVGGQGSRTGNPGGGNAPPSPKGIDDEIAEAEKAGDLDKSLRLKTLKAAQQQAS